MFFCEVKGGGEFPREVDGAGVVVVMEVEVEGGKCVVRAMPFVVECEEGSVSRPAAGTYANDELAHHWPSNAPRFALDDEKHGSNLASAIEVPESEEGDASVQLASSKGGWAVLLEKGRTGKGRAVFLSMFKDVVAEVSALAAQWNLRHHTPQQGHNCPPLASAPLLEKEGRPTRPCYW